MNIDKNKIDLILTMQEQKHKYKKIYFKPFKNEIYIFKMPTLSEYNQLMLQLDNIKSNEDEKSLQVQLFCAVYPVNTNHDVIMKDEDILEIFLETGDEIIYDLTEHENVDAMVDKLVAMDQYNTDFFESIVKLNVSLQSQFPQSQYMFNQIFDLPLTDAQLQYYVLKQLFDTTSKQDNKIKNNEDGTVSGNFTGSQIDPNDINSQLQQLQEQKQMFGVD